MLTAGRISDIRAAELLTREVTRFHRLVADKGYEAASERLSEGLGPRQSFRAAPTASGASATTSGATAIAG